MEKEQIIALAERFVQGIATEEEKALASPVVRFLADDEELVPVDHPQSPEAIREKIPSCPGHRIQENLLRCSCKTHQKKSLPHRSRFNNPVTGSRRSYYTYIQRTATL